MKAGIANEIFWLAWMIEVRGAALPIKVGIAIALGSLAMTHCR